MQTEFPTKEIYFGFAFTYCKLRVYEDQESFIRQVLEIHDVEFLEPQVSNSWQEIDTRLLSDLICGAVPKLLAQAGLTGRFARQVLETLSINKSISLPFRL
jgi:hypothetical protein